VVALRLPVARSARSRSLRVTKSLPAAEIWWAVQDGSDNPSARAYRGEGSGRWMVAGAGFEPDWERERTALVTSHWVYVLAKQGAREMQRIGLAA